ncbi:methyltransferase [Corynebacterium aquatimens]|uniref:methyltransferase n=1 Tax=Corynebacterium aquatimens TaxID=1190508 RepID=UPI003313BA4F
MFSGAKPDRGGELLRSALPDSGLGRFLDLGCGNGSVSRGLAGAADSVSATDSDADAVLSARAIGLDATWDDAGSRYPAGSFDTIALNPPFHDGTAVDATLVQHLLDAAKRLLAPAGSCTWCTIRTCATAVRWSGALRRLNKSAAMPPLPCCELASCELAKPGRGRVRARPSRRRGRARR